MSTTKIGPDVSLEEIQRRLSDALGHGYKVTATSDSALKIQRAPLVTAKVNVKWYDDGTTLQVARARPGSCKASTRSPSTRRSAAPFPGRS